MTDLEVVNKAKNEAILRAEKVEKQLDIAKKLIRSLLYVYQLEKSELATARIMAEAEQFLKETKNV